MTSLKSRPKMHVVADLAESRVPVQPTSTGRTRRRPMRLTWLAAILGISLSGVPLSCASSSNVSKRNTNDDDIQDFALASSYPRVLLPGSTITLLGSGFVPDNIGVSRLVLKGTYEGRDIDITLPAHQVSGQRIDVPWPGAVKAGLGAEPGILNGTAVVEAFEDDGLLHTSPPLSVAFNMRGQLQPDGQAVATGVIFVNDPIEVVGTSFLLGGDEGTTKAVVQGCFKAQGSSQCLPHDAIDIPATPITPGDRTRISFPFSHNIAGVQPGTFQGTVFLRNDHGKDSSGASLSSKKFDVTYEIQPTMITSLTPAHASLGQYVDIDGGGFVGDLSGNDQTTAYTSLILGGVFKPQGAPDEIKVNVTLIPEFVSGRHVRYVFNEEDQLGTSIDLRQVAGTFDGTITPEVHYHGDSLRGSAAKTTFALQPVKQVVWVNFLPVYVGSLRHFGLRTVDQLIRARVMRIAKRDYDGVNMEFVSDEPTQFALYERVDISGPDPNGYGLLGYDNSPGKDVENKRLYDRIGGVNAATQEDGYPGYGGVFVDSFFGFSEHPGKFAKSLDGADPFFDSIFDPFRPDTGGTPVSAEDLTTLHIPDLDSGDACPPKEPDRGMQIACAVWVLGSMIGSTMTHEVGHSLGLSDPWGAEFHNSGDAENRLMDSGRYRPFLERAEIFGRGPAVFCDGDYEYLRKYLPTSKPDPLSSRPACW